MTTSGRLAYVATIGLTLLLFAMRARAQAPLAADSYVSAGNKATNFGGGANLIVRTGGSATKTFLQFNLSRLPASATSTNITKATMRLYVNTVTTGGNLDVVTVTSPWSESTITFNLQPSLGPVAVAAVPITTNNSFVLVDVTALVQLWIAGSGGGGIANNGIALVPSTGSSINVQFDSKETGTTSHNAEIEIDFVDSSITTGLGNLQTQINQEVVNRQNGDVSTLAQASAYTNTSLTSYARLAAVNQFTASQNITGDLGVSGNLSTNLLSLPTTTSPTMGVVASNGSAFLHAFGIRNTFMGQGAGNFAMTGTDNTASGNFAMSSNTTGTENAAMGAAALQNNTTGKENTASGGFALRNNTTGFQNTASGDSALFNNTTGNGNTAAGQAALIFNTTGNENTAGGHAALQNNTTGSNNIALGYQAGLTVTLSNANTTGSNNTFLGSNSGPGTATQLNNATAIGSNALVAQSNAMVLGDGTINVGIGTQTPGKTLDVVGDIRSTGTTTAAHFVGDGSGLTGIAAGAATSVNCTGCITNTQLGVNYAGSASQGGPATSALSANIATTAATATNSLALGGLAAGSFATLAANTFTADQTINGNVNANSLNLPATSSSVGVINSAGARLLHTFGSNNVFVGPLAGNFSLTSSFNTAVGPQALSNSTSGSQNTAVGFQALLANTTGSNNTATGLQALLTNTSGFQNTANGVGALSTNTTGSQNTGDGVSALAANTIGAQNTASGDGALGNNSTGNQNTAAGFLALDYNNTGSNNTAVGYFAGLTTTTANANTTGSNNTFLGSNSGPGTATQLNNATAIGSNALVAQSNAMVLGDGTINVGIGTQMPGKTLDVVGDIRSSGTTTAQHFVGDGSGLTGLAAGPATSVNCTGCITNTQLGVNYAGSTSQGGPATSALSAVTAASATNALALGGLPASSFATLGGNAFTSDQVVNGAVSANVLNLPTTTGGTVGVINSGGSNFLHNYGTYNTFLGVNTGNFTMSGSANTAMGLNALSSNTGGTWNTGIGVDALNSNTSGEFNTASGVFALETNTTGNGNTATGYNALAGNTTGTGNVAIGQVAGASNYANSTGSNNTFLGASTGLAANSQVNNSTAIGAGTLLAQSNTIIMGNGLVSVGIGTQTPAHTLDVVGDGNFSGNLNVAGTLTKGGGSFKIDHPLEPANRYLSHSFVESPDMMNIYNGNATLNQKGEAVVELPGWFEALNRDFRYQLTCIGGFAPVFIAREISHNRFKIAGGRPGLRVSWQVTGIRQDAYANAHRIPVEEDKPAEERGYYLHPDAFGMPATRGIAWASANRKSAAPKSLNGSGNVSSATAHRFGGLESPNQAPAKVTSQN